MFQGYHTKTKASHRSVWLRYCKKKCRTAKHKMNYMHQQWKHFIKVVICKKKCIKHSEKQWTKNTNQTMKKMKKMRMTKKKTRNAMRIQRSNEVCHCNTEYKTR